jgi:hypothetical protein
MGLDTTHDAWHGAYSAFSRWRNELARVAGYRLARDPGGITTSVVLPWEDFTMANLLGEWSSMPGDDPLLWLIIHSDCDGVIHPEQGTLIAARLEGLLPELDDTEASGHIYPSMRAKTQVFIDGLRAAAEAGEDVEFC